MSPKIKKNIVGLTDFHLKKVKKVNSNLFFFQVMLCFNSKEEVYVFKIKSQCVAWIDVSGHFAL